MGSSNSSNAVAGIIERRLAEMADDIERVRALVDATRERPAADWARAMGQLQVIGGALSELVRGVDRTRDALVKSRSTDPSAAPFDSEPPTLH